jgi:hypothetical protein
VNELKELMGGINKICTELELIGTVEWTILMNPCYSQQGSGMFLPFAGTTK